MAFATQEDVFSVIEDVFPPIFAQYGTYHTASKAPFRRISFNDAMETYGSDKPDLRIDLTVQDATKLLSGCGFGPFEGNVVKAIVVTDFAVPASRSTDCAPRWRCSPATKGYWFRYDENGEIRGPALPNLWRPSKMRP